MFAFLELCLRMRTQDYKYVLWVERERERFQGLRSSSAAGDGPGGCVCSAVKFQGVDRPMFFWVKDRPMLKRCFRVIIKISCPLSRLDQAARSGI